MATKATSKKAPAKRKTAKKPASRKATPKAAPEVTIQVPQQTAEQKHAKVQAYATLKNAGLEIPAELALEVEALVAAQIQKEKENTQALQAAQSAEEKAIKAQNEEGPKWVRNLFNGPFSFRLKRQDEKEKKVELKPRGQRGDLYQLEEKDLKDSNLLMQLETGFVELIGDGEAKLIISKQVRNMRGQHTPLAVLRNEHGKIYEGDPLKVELEYSQQGITVGVTDPRINPEDDKSVARARGLGLLRPEQVSQFVPTGGNPAIISDGFADRDARARIADDIARRKGLEGPESAGILSVQIAPTEKT